MDVLADGLSVLQGRGQTVFSILLMILWGQVVFVSLLHKISKFRFTPAEYISIGSVGWIFPVTVMAPAIFIGHLWLDEMGIYLVIILAIIFFVLSLIHIRDLIPAFLIFISILLIPLILRLAFISKLALPIYFDSAEHYRIIKELSAFFTSHTFESPTINYYHIGFHLISAALIKLFGLNTADTMLVFGQVILAILPFSLFFIVKQESNSTAVAVFTCLLAGFGWHMPSHLMNWGKYPALLSLVCIIFVINLFYILFKNNHGRSLYILSSFGILISVLIHSRTAILFVFLALSILLTYWFQRRSSKIQISAFAFILLILIIEFWFVQNAPALSLLISGYIHRDIWMLFLVLTLLPFAILYFPTQAFFLLGSLSTLTLGLFIPVHLPNLGLLTLLDRPYVQALLYLPLSLLGGFGMAGLFQVIRKITLNQKQLEYGVAFLFTGFVVWNAIINQSFLPSDGCQITTRDDLAAMQWINISLPGKSIFYIASTQLNVTLHEQVILPSGVDGGIWVQPLTSRRSIYFGRDTNFGSAKSHDQVCQIQESYIYVGGMPQSFPTAQLERHPDWYQLVFTLPQARIYKVIGCQSPPT